MGNFPSAEMNTDLNLVACVKKSFSPFNSYFKVIFGNDWTKTQLFQHRFNSLDLFFLLFFFKKELLVVDNTNNRRVAVRRHFNKILSLLAGFFKSFLEAQLLIKIRSDYSDSSSPNRLIYTVKLFNSLFSC